MRFTMTQSSYYSGLQVYSGGAWKTGDYNFTITGAKGGSPIDRELSGEPRMQFGDYNWGFQMYQVQCSFSDVDSTNRIKMFSYNSQAYNAHGGTSTSNSSVSQSLATWAGGTGAITGLRVIADPQGTAGTFDYGWFVLEGYAP